MRFLLHYVAVRPLGFLLLALLVIAQASSSVGVQYAMKLLIDAMTVPGSVLAQVQVALLAFIGLVALESLLLRGAAALLCRLSVASGVRIRLDMFDYLTGHQLSFFQNQRAGSLGHRVGALTGSFNALIHRFLMEIAPPLIAFGGALIIFLTIDVAMSALLAIVFVLTSVVLVALGLRGDSHHKEFARQAGNSGGELVDVIGNIWAVKAFAARRQESDRLRALFEIEATAQRRGWFFVERIRAFHDIALVVLVGGTLFWAISRWAAGAITVGDVVVVSAMTFRMLNGSRDMAMALIDTSQQFSYLGETLEVIGVPHTLRDAPGAGALQVDRGTLRLEEVTFGYDPHRPVLHDVSIDIPAGQKVGIVGPSGAGKSTILQLVQRLYDAQAGRLLIDGQAIDGVTQESLHAALAVVPQEVLLFHRSILENIRFARPDASDAEVLRAATAARCDEFIREMPQGYLSIVGERGTNLSGGQRQRIGIARAFLKDSKIVLLDEATSALDTGSELAVQEGLDALMADRTVLAVAHRLSTVVTFDRILVVEDGRIVEDGAPHQLLRDGGAFRRLWALQAEGMEQSLAGALRPAKPTLVRAAR
ncbi:ABC transporter ATP-binding protein [Sphingomonas sp. HITSZ_GF]|uniref:ABC transporter ATP-binding protein n=1 Tax=Sphingomonas sp. HITSZ_GF TaxID=3037247 RepID=UPI00240D0BBC|nr:ABC transporter ATP-binding protein [Sphingomonas sp. HITSZ_GF]MDG2532985.1 ABC transporter ATP-binding protein [Sphingomonas sp. HITSZ_GF]